MSFKKILASMLAVVAACGMSAAALTLDSAEAANDAVVAEAVLAESNVAKIGDTFYATVQEAVDAAVAGATVIELQPGTIDEDVFILQKADTNITIKGTEGLVYSGTFNVCGNGRSYSTNVNETVTFENIDFVLTNPTASQDFITSNRKETVNGVTVYSYPHNVTVRNCTFTGSRDYDIVAVRNVGGYNWTMENCTGTGLHSFIWANYNTLSSTISNVTLTNSKSGFSLGTNANYTITDCVIDVDEYAVRSDANSDRNVKLVVKNCKINAAESFIVRNADSKNFTYDVEISDSKIISTVADITRAGAAKADDTISFDIDLNYWGGDAPVIGEIAGFENDVLPYYTNENMTAVGGVEAMIGETYYTTFAEAAAAAVANDTITLVSNIAFSNRNASLEPKVENIVYDLNGYTMTLGGDHVFSKNVTFKNGTIAISDELVGTGVFWVWNTNNTLTFDNVAIVNAGDSINACSIFTTSSNAPAFVLRSCTINLTNNTFNPDDGGNLFYFNNNATNVTLENTTIGVDSFTRGFQYGTYDVDNCEITMTNMNGNAFRRCDAVITDSTVIVEGSENGMKLDGNNVVVIEGNSYVRILGAAANGYDLVVNENSSVNITEEATLYVDTTNVAQDAVTGNAVVLANTINVVFEQVDGDAEGYNLYNINLVGANKETINRLNSADLTFILDKTPVTGGNMSYEIIAVEKITVTPDAETAGRYMFNFNGKTAVNDTANTITLAQVKVSGYGAYSFYVDTNATTNEAHATTISDNIVDTFVPGGATGKGTLNLGDATTGNVTIAVPVRTLTVKVAFPNSVEDNAVLYQDMKVEITGNIDGVQQTVTYDLGGNMTADGTYVVTEDRLVLNDTYNVVVSGAGYRTARYTVTMTDAKTLNFWNNVKDNKVEVEEGKASSATEKNFLAGDIVADNQINIYDLSAVVSYFATEITDEADYEKYVKYDLNRDGVINSKDVAYVLVSWQA